MRKLGRIIYDLNLFICIISIISLPFAVLSEVVINDKISFDYTISIMIIFCISFSIYLLLRNIYERKL